MGFRFRKSIKLFPGIRLNLSKSGVSASIGRPGATVNISERGTRGTVGIPGTGMSYSEQLSRPHATPEQTPQQESASEGMGFAALLSWLLFFVVMIFTGIQFRLSNRWVYYEVG